VSRSRSTGGAIAPGGSGNGGYEFCSSLVIVSMPPSKCPPAAVGLLIGAPTVPSVKNASSIECFDRYKDDK